MPKLHRSYKVKGTSQQSRKRFLSALKYTCLGVASMNVCTSLYAKEAPVQPEKKRPNVLYVFPDQFRNSAMGFWRDSLYREHVRWQGDPVHTPRLNAFAKQSVVFSNALSNCPVSSAHRGMLLTGLYPNKSGVSLNCNATRPISDLRDDLTCLSDVFHKAGYDCAYIGKLHAHFPTKNNPQRPGTYVNDDHPCWDAYTPAERRHGFDYWYSYGTFDVHKNPHYWDAEGNYHEPHEYSPKHEADKAIAYLQAHVQNTDSDAPFFMMIGMNPPHSPYKSLDDCMEEDYNLYKDIPTDSLLVRKNINYGLQDKLGCAPYYFANVTGVDREFGRILDALDSLGLAENTIVVFSSDHGETMCSHVRDPKNTVYTESMNIPFMVRYPMALQPAVNDGMLSAIDIMPTVVGMAGLSHLLPDSLPGYDWTEQMRTKVQPAQTPRAVLYLQNVDGEKDAEGNVLTYFPRCRGVVTERYTLSFTINRKNQLVETLFFDNWEDPYQTNNLPLSSHPQVVQQLLDEFQRLLNEADDPWVTLLPTLDIKP